MKDEKGFTLIEVLASLVIISIVLMSFMSIFSNTNALAVSNTEKLVVINLADAYLERIKANPTEFISPFPPLIEDSSMGVEQALLKINNRFYKVEVIVTQNHKEFADLHLLNTLVKVTSETSGLSSSVEGYVPYENPKANDN